MKKAETSKAYDIGDFPPYAVTVDIVIFTVADRQLQVLLIKRANSVERGKWALPGGFKRPDETLDQAAARELLEETSLTAPGHLAQFHAYGDPRRDPRGNIVTIAYLAAVPPRFEVIGGSDAEHAEVVSVDDVIDGKVNLAFDHRQIITDARDYIRQERDRTDVALSFLDPTFTLSELRIVHEAISGTTLDPGNFRRAIMSQDPPLVQSTGDRADSGPGGGRPPEIFRSAGSIS